MDWTIGPLDHWTLGPLDYFLDSFWGHFSDHFLDHFFGTILSGEADHKYLGRGGMQLISTQGGVVGGLLLLREESSTNYQYAARGGRLMYK